MSRVWGVASEMRNADEVASKQKTNMSAVTEQSSVTVVVCSSRDRASQTGSYAGVLDRRSLMLTTAEHICASFTNAIIESGGGGNVRSFSARITGKIGSEKKM